MTDHNAPKRRLIAVSAINPTAVPGGKSFPKQMMFSKRENLFGSVFYASWLKDARGKVTRHDINGKLLGEMELPGVGTVSGFGGKRDAEETFFSFTNYVTPASIYRVSLPDGKITCGDSPKSISM